MMNSQLPVSVAEDRQIESGGGPAVDSSDGGLLERFITLRDELAFEALLRRHGPMVLGVCRRTLHNAADADDAFQATFLVLVRKAATIRPRRMVGNWLYGVAHSTALKAKAMSIKRAAKEKEAARHVQPPTSVTTWDELRPRLDRELKSLPDKYRAAIVLCDLEGMSIKDAAEQLGCPIGTVGTRVARGREMLARRMRRYGIAPSAGELAHLVSQNALPVAVPADLMSSTAKAAVLAAKATKEAASISAKVAELTASVLRAMMLAKVKLAVLIVLAVGAIAFAGVGLTNNRWHGRGEHIRRERPDGNRLAGTWVVVAVIQAGEELPKDIVDEYGEWTFDCDQYTVASSGSQTGTIRLDWLKRPNQIDLAVAGAEMPVGRPPLNGIGIYSLDGRDLRICLASPSPAGLPQRPAAFVSQAGEHPTSLFILQRKVGACCH